MRPVHHHVHASTISIRPGIGWRGLDAICVDAFTFADTDKLISINDFASGWDVASLFLVTVMLLSTLMHFFLILKMSQGYRT